jgi:hypothetical protein
MSQAERTYRVCVPGIGLTEECSTATSLLKILLKAIQGCFVRNSRFAAELGKPSIIETAEISHSSAQRFAFRSPSGIIKVISFVGDGKSPRLR